MPTPPLDNFLRRRGSSLLMWVLVAVILASPLADSYPRIGAALAVIVQLTVLIGASFAGNRKIVVLVAIPVSVLWIVARLLEEFGSGQHPWNHLAHFCGLALSCTILWAIFDRIGSTAEVTSSVIAEASFSYLTLAIAFSQIYWILDEFLVNAFSQKIPLAHSTTFLYFSMITLSGVGYGDITPVNPFVRLISAFESMTGIFFVAVVVSRLVAAYQPHPGPRPLEGGMGRDERGARST